MINEIEALYPLVFFSTLASLVVLERFPKFQRRAVRPGRRWMSNVGLLVLVGMLARLAPSANALAFSMQQPPGVMQLLGMPTWAQAIVGLVVLDFWYYWAHRLYHQVQLLWRVHLVHHSDTDIDVTTAERHHPLEVLLSSALLLTWIFLLGIPVEALGLYMLIAAFLGLFSHANINLPATLDRWLRTIVVTPNYHAIHHSALKTQTNSNYASIFSIWDRLFNTYSSPDKSPVKTTGLEYFNQPKDAGIVAIILQPFLYKAEFSKNNSNYKNISHSEAANVNNFDSKPALSKAWERALLSAVAGVMLSTLAMWPTVSGLIEIWQENEAYRYAWLVIPYITYLLGWYFLDEISAFSPNPSWIGVLISIIAALLYAASEIININIGREIGLIAVIHAIILASLGFEIYKKYFTVFFLLFLLIPNGDLLQPVLKFITIQSIDFFASLIGLPHTINGFSIIIGKLHYFVVDACSGLTHFNLIFFLGYCFGLMLFRAAWKVAAFALFSGGLGILSNMIRVNAIIYLDWLQGTQMSLTSHGNVQWLGLGIVFLILFLALAFAKPDPAPCSESSRSQLTISPQDTRLDRIPLYAGLSAFLIAFASIYLPSQVEPAGRMDKQEWIPPLIDGWTSIAPNSTWRFEHSSETQLLSAAYQRKEQVVGLTVIEPISSTGKLPSRLSPASENAEWRNLRTERVSNCPAAQCENFLYTVWMRNRSDPLRHLYYAFSDGMFTTDSDLALRAASGWQRLTRHNSHPRLIGLTFEGTAPSQSEVTSLHQEIRSALRNRDNTAN